MSIDAISWVLRQSRSTRGARLVLIVLAEFANEDASSWPSVATIAKRANISERAVPDALAKLVALGELDIRHGAGPRGCSRYRLTFAGEGSSPEVSSPPEDSSGGSNQQKGVKKLRRQPEVTSPNPSGTSREPSSSSRPAPPKPDDDDRIADALEVIAAHRTARLQTPPRNPGAYRRSTVARLDAEWRSKLAGMLAALPDATAGQLAAWVLDQDDPPPADAPPGPCAPRPCSDPGCARCDGDGVIFDDSGAVVGRCWAEPTPAPPSIGEWSPDPIGATS